MEREVGQSDHDHVINITHGSTSPSSSHGILNGLGTSQERAYVGSTHSENPSSSALSTSRNSASRRGDNYVRRRRSPLSSGLWIPIEFAIAVSQIIASIIVLALSRHEKPKAPLFVWVVGYASGCLATLPLLYWRYITRNSVPIQESSQANGGPGRNNPTLESSSHTTASTSRTSEGNEEFQANTNSLNGQNTTLRNRRVAVLVDYFKVALDCFFAIWFVVGNVLIFGGYTSSSEAPNLYRLCIVFLTISFIGYAMPFVLCTTLCCCLPCLISVLGFREDHALNRGATSETIRALPNYKFKGRGARERNKDENDMNNDNSMDGGIVAAGTERERFVSAEDAVCSICLAKYVDDDELRKLPCEHFFHTECIDKWLKINALCPLCKHEVGGSSSCATEPSSRQLHGNRRVAGAAVAVPGFGMV